MVASCSDFTDNVLNALGAAKLVREADVPADDPGRQSEIALDVIRRLMQIKELAAALATIVVTSTHTMDDDATAAARALTHEIESVVPRWLVSNEWEHCFVGSKATRTRWAVDLETAEMVHAQSFGDIKWSDLHRDEIADLRESVMDVNEVRLNPEAHGAELRDLPPLWATARSVDGADATP